MFSSRKRLGGAAAKKPSSVRLGLEALESRLTPYSTSGNAWAHPELITLGFVPDGTILGSNASGAITSNLNASFNARFGSAATWQKEILRAAQTWAQQTNINFALVTDQGAAIGTGLYQQGDPLQADIRIGGYNFGTTTLAQAYMPQPVNDTPYAGDIQFNTGQTWNVGNTYDLYTVAVHEIGHSLGLYHTSVISANLYSSYQGVKAGLASDDIAGIQSVYSSGLGRSKDSYDATADNGSFSAATNVSGTINVAAKTALLSNLELTTTSDADYYKFTVPAGLGGTLTVNVQSSGFSLLAPMLTLYNASQAQLATQSGLNQYGTTLTVSSSVTAGQTYYVKVAGADATAFGTGRYALTLAFGGAASPAVALPNTQLLNGDDFSSGGGQATRISDEARVNTFATGNQYFHYTAARGLAMDANGNYVLVWSSTGQDGSGDGVYGQRFSAAGTPLGGEFRINTYTANDQYGPSVAMAPDGRFVVAWQSYGQDGSGQGVYAQRYDAAGNAVGGEFRVNTTTSNNQQRPAVAVDNIGNFVIVWDSGKTQDIFGQRYNANGVPQGGEFRVNSYTSSDQWFPAVGMDAAGNFTVAWISTGQDGSGFGIYGQRYNASGATQGSEFRISTSTSGDQTQPKITMNASGEAIVLWEGSGASDSYGVYGQRYDSNGAAQGGEFRVNTTTAGTQWTGSVALDNSGNFLITWMSGASLSATNWDIVGQQYDDEGEPLGSEFRVSTTSSTNTDAVMVSMDSIGHAVIAWSGSGSGDSAGIYAERFAIVGGSGLAPMQAFDTFEPDGHADPAVETPPSRRTRYALPPASGRDDLRGLVDLLQRSLNAPSQTRPADASPRSRHEVRSQEHNANASGRGTQRETPNLDNGPLDQRSHRHREGRATEGIVSEPTRHALESPD